MKFRDAARMVLPYGVVRAIRRRNMGIVGRYRSWEDALRATGPYRPEMAALIESVRKYRDGEPSFLNRYDPSSRVIWYPLLAGLLTASARCGGRLSVLDFGGEVRFLSEGCDRAEWRCGCAGRRRTFASEGVGGRRERAAPAKRPETAVRSAASAPKADCGRQRQAAPPAPQPLIRVRVHAVPPRIDRLSGVSPLSAPDTRCITPPPPGCGGSGSGSGGVNGSSPGSPGHLFNLPSHYPSYYGVTPQSGLSGSIGAWT